MLKKLAICVIIAVLLFNTAAYAERDMLNQINALPISQSEYLALQWQVFMYDNFNFGFFGQMLWIMYALNLNTLLWVTYPWQPLPPTDPWNRN